MTRPMKQTVTFWLLCLACATVVLAMTFSAGRFSARVIPVRPIQWMRDDYEEQQSVSGFDGLVKRWNAYVVEQDGYLPFDPYRAMLESGKVQSFYELVHVVFSAPANLPSRINPHLAENAKWVVFWQRREDLGEEWVCYTDGTWERMPDDKTRVLTQRIYQPEDAGWRDFREQREWIARNRDKLVWDAARKMYVPTMQPQEE